MSEQKTMDKQAEWPTHVPAGALNADEHVHVGDKSETHIGVMARWDQTSRAMKTSIDPREQRGRALISQCMEAADLNIRNAAGQIWPIVDFFAHEVELLVEETGEMTRKIRLVMVCSDGRMISTVSEPCIRTFAMLSQFYGPGPWEPPVMIRVREHKGKNGHTYCTLAEVVVAETIAAKTENGTKPQGERKPSVKPAKDV